MTDNIAVLDGFTQELHVVSYGKELFLLIKPGTDLTDDFRAWDMDQQEYVTVPSFRLEVRQQLAEVEAQRMECGHTDIEDCLVCNVCGNCSESLDDNDVCSKCKQGMEDNAACERADRIHKGYESDETTTDPHPNAP